MSLLSHLFAGVTDYFHAYLAKSYKDVVRNAAGRFDPAALRQNRLNTITQYRQQLAQNPNLTPEDIDAMVFRRMLRHQAGDAIETVFGRVGQVGSFMGGTVGYLSKQVGKVAFKTTWMATKATAISAGAVAGATALGVGVAGKYAIKATGKALKIAYNASDSLGINTAVANATKSTAKFIGRGVADYSKELGKDAWNLGKFLWQNRNSRGIQLATIGTGLALMPAAYEQGEREAKYQYKMQQVTSNSSVSDDGGGTFLRPNFRPPISNRSSIDNSVDDHGATGDLVFALHSLRHGG